jgi:micrococcal nuclease
MDTRNVEIVRIVDGDTINIDIDLGFGVSLLNQRIRLMGIDTPEIHSSDKEEKHYGNLAKVAVEEWIARALGHPLCIIYDPNNCRGKFGRILGDIKRVKHEETLCQYLVREHHAVAYHGQNKEDIKEEHIKNRAIHGAIEPLSH